MLWMSVLNSSIYVYYVQSNNDSKYIIKIWILNPLSLSTDLSYDHIVIMNMLRTILYDSQSC